MRKIINTTSSSSIYIFDDDIFDVTNVLKKFNLKNTINGNQWNIPNGIVGQLITDNLKIIIHPKIHYMDTIDYLKLILIDDLENEENSYSGFDDSTNNLSNFLINNFLIELKTAINEGIPKKYKAKSINSNFFIGNIEISESYMRNILDIRPSVSTKIEELDNDYYNTRVIKSAYEKLINISAKYRIPSLINGLNGINNTIIKYVNVKEEKIRLTKNNKAFIKAFKLAVLIINDMNIAHKIDDYNISLLFNCNKIFEDFIYELLSVKFPKDGFDRHFTLISAKSDKKNIVSIPDIIIRCSHDIILDVKNKNFDKSVTSDNFHQMISYKKTFGIKTSILVYPYFADIDGDAYKITNDNNLKMYAIPIDIKNRKFENFLDQVEKIMRFN